MNIVRRNNFLPSAPFFDDFFTRDLFNWLGESNESNTLPRVNIQETNDEFWVEVAAPGMKKDDFHIELDNDTLMIRSEVSDQAEKEDQHYTRREFRYQSFQRTFHLPNTVESDKIKAQYKDGILRLVIPKKEEAKKRPVKTISVS